MLVVRPHPFRVRTLQLVAGPIRGSYLVNSLLPLITGSMPTITKIYQLNSNLDVIKSTIWTTLEKSKAVSSENERPVSAKQTFGLNGRNRLLSSRIEHPG